MQCEGLAFFDILVDYVVPLEGLVVKIVLAELLWFSGYPVFGMPKAALGSGVDPVELRR